MTALVTDQLLNTGSRKVQFWVYYFLAIMIFYINMKTPYSSATEIPTANSEF